MSKMSQGDINMITDAAKNSSVVWTWMHQTHLPKENLAHVKLRLFLSGVEVRSYMYSRYGN